MAPAFLNPAKKTVCVMDASGRPGSALVRRLLRRGYTVHAAVVHNQHADEMQWFGEVCSENKKHQQLRVFHSDPLDYHSILEALKGCCGLFYSFDQPTYDLEMTAELEVRAAHNVLEATARTDTLDKVVFTSSATAVIWRDHQKTTASSNNHNVDEKKWSDVNFCKKFKLWHGLSKTLAEKTAWALAMDRGVNMVSINAGLLMAPELTIKHPYLKGAAEMYKDGVFVTVDLCFLVDAHICVFEDVSSFGRYLCFNRVINSNQAALNLFANMLLLPPTATPTLISPAPEDTRLFQQKICNNKLSKLMLDLDSRLVQMDDLAVPQC